MTNKLAVATAVLIDWYYTDSFKFSVLLRSSFSISIVGLAGAIFDRYLWRWKLLQGWFVHRPDISGRWKVKIIPLKADPSTGKRSPKKSYYFDIFQTYSKLDVQMQDGPESNGETITSNIRRSEGNRYELVVTYRNEPKASVRKRSVIHLGTMKLKIEGPTHAPVSLKGSYWTDRETRGEIVAIRDRQ